MKNVNSAELGWYEEAVLDVCCRNILAADELWDRIVEVSVLLLTSTQQTNPRSPWYVFLLYLCLLFVTYQCGIKLVAQL